MTTGAFIPQVVKTIRTKDTSGISLGMYTMQLAGVVLWLCYGLSIHDGALIMANGVTSVLSSIILGYKLKEVFGKQNNRNKKMKRSGSLG